MHSMQCPVVRPGEPLTRRLTLHQVASLEPAEEHHRDEEEDGNHGHDDTEGTSIFMPGVHFTVFKVGVDIIHEFKLEVYSKRNGIRKRIKSANESL